VVRVPTHGGLDLRVWVLHCKRQAHGVLVQVSVSMSASCWIVIAMGTTGGEKGSISAAALEAQCGERLLPQRRAPHPSPPPHVVDGGQQVEARHIQLVHLPAGMRSRRFGGKLGGQGTGVAQDRGCVVSRSLCDSGSVRSRPDEAGAVEGVGGGVEHAGQQAELQQEQGGRRG
jgi:hypothetical protein